MANSELTDTMLAGIYSTVNRNPDLYKIFVDARHGLTQKQIEDGGCHGLSCMECLLWEVSCASTYHWAVYKLCLSHIHSIDIDYI